MSKPNVYLDCKKVEGTLTDYENGTDQFMGFIRGTKLLTAEEERALIVAYKENGCIKSRDELVERNLRLCVNIAGKSAHKHRTVASQLFGYAVEGLIKGIDKFDHSQMNDNGTPIRLTTYVIWWIKQNVDRLAWEELTPMRVPAEIHGLRIYGSLYASRHMTEHGEFPTKEQIEEAVIAEFCRRRAAYGQSTGEMPKYMHEAIFRKDVPIMSECEFSFKTSDDENEENKRILDTEFADFDEGYDAAEAVEKLLNEANLKEKERFVIVERMGLKGAAFERDGTTLENIGENFWYARYGRTITRERVRQIEAAGLTKLKKFLSIPLNYERYQDLIGD